MTIELAIAGLTGGIHKMLVAPGRELYDIDAYIDDEFGEANNNSDNDDNNNNNNNSIFHRTINPQYNASTDSTENDSTICPDSCNVADVEKQIRQLQNPEIVGEQQQQQQPVEVSNKNEVDVVTKQQLGKQEKQQPQMTTSNDKGSNKEIKSDTQCNIPMARPTIDDVTAITSITTMTNLDPDTDPFAPRSGKTLLWRNVNMTLVCLFFDHSR
jgi:hypothetical protein